MRILIEKILIEFFYISTAALIFFSLLELIWPRLVFAYFNIAWLLIAWLTNAIILLIIKSNNKV